MKQAALQSDEVTSIAPPDDVDVPSEIGQGVLNIVVAGNVSLEFSFPKVCPAFGSVGEPAASMSMPEAAVHEQYEPPTR